MTCLFAVSFDRRMPDGGVASVGGFTFVSTDARTTKSADVRASHRKAAKKAKEMAARKFKLSPSVLILRDLRAVG